MKKIILFATVLAASGCEMLTLGTVLSLAAPVVEAVASLEDFDTADAACAFLKAGGTVVLQDETTVNLLADNLDIIPGCTGAS